MRHLTAGVAILAIVFSLPALALAGNQEVANQIAVALQQQSRSGEFDGVRIKVKDGVAWLNGPVPSKGDLQRALSVAHSLGDVKRVINEMQVAPEFFEPEQPAQPVAQPMPAATAQPIPVAQPQPQAQPPQQALPTPPVQVAQPAAAMRQQPSGQPVHYQAQPHPAQMAAYPQGQPIPMHAARHGGHPHQPVAYMQQGAPIPMGAGAHAIPSAGYGVPVRYDQPALPNHAWPSYAAYPNYAAVTYPRMHSAQAWPYIGPFYPYPQVPLGWRKVTLEWDDGWWMLDFDDR